MNPIVVGLLVVGGFVAVLVALAFMAWAVGYGYQSGQLGAMAAHHRQHHNRGQDKLPKK